MFKALFGRVDKGVGSAVNWVGLFTLLGGGTLLTALGTWAASAWEPIAAQGWGATVFAGAALACVIMLALSIAALAGGMAYRKFKPLSPPGTPSEIKYNFGLAGGDRYVEGTLGEILSAYEERTIQGLEDRAQKLKSELAPQDHAEKIAAMDSDIKSDGRGIHKLSESLKQADRTILQLVDFATHQAVAASLNEMIMSAPRTPPDEELSEETRTPQLEYLSKVRSQLGGTHRGQSVANILQMAEHEAERIIEDTPIERRNPADPIRYRRWAIANRQVASLVMFLKAQKRETEERIVGYRSALIEELTKRQT